MNRSSTIIWIGIIFLLLLPGSVGRFLLDIAGSLLLILLILPFLLSGLGWIGWKILKSQMKTCENCGASYFGEISQCSICGSSQLKNDRNLDSNENIPASAATIDVIPKENN